MKKNIRARVIAIIIALSVMLSACNIKNDIIAPWQQQKGIDPTCSVIC